MSLDADSSRARRSARRGATCDCRVDSERVRLPKRSAVGVGVTVLLLAFAWWLSRAPQASDVSTDAGSPAAIVTTTPRRADRPAADAGSAVTPEFREPPQPGDAVVEGRIVVLPSWSPVQTTVTLESERHSRQTVVSNDAGVFSTQLSPGAWRVVGTEDDFAPSSASAALFVSPGERSTTAVVCLTRLEWLEGVVVDDEDHLLAEAQVDDVFTDSLGQFKVRGSSAQLRVSHPCCQTDHYAVSLDGGSMRIALDRWEAPSVGQIHGQVVDRDGRPCEAFVGLVSAPAGQAPSRRTTRTGAFVLPLFAPSSRVFALVRGTRVESEELRDGDHTRLVADCQGPTLEVTGRLIDEFGAPWTSCWMETSFGPASWFSSGLGRFSFRVPRARTRTRLTLGCVGNDETVMATVLPWAGDVDLGDLVLNRDRNRIEGLVINRETRKAIASALISDGSDQEVTTDERGAFALSLKPRPRELRVSALGFLPYAVQLSANATSLTIDLAPEPADGGPSGEYEGIGLRWSVVDAGVGLLVELLHPSGPAAEAGVREGDELLAVDGEPAIDVAIAVLMPRMKGPAGSWVKLTLRRAGSVFDLNVQRRRLAW